MTQWKAWPLWSKALFAAFALYATLPVIVSITAFVDAAGHGWPLHALDICMQLLMLTYLPMLLVGLYRPQLATGLLFLGTAADLALMFGINGSTGDGAAAMAAGSVLFLGVPMLGAAIFMRSAARRSATTKA